MIVRVLFFLLAACVIPAARAGDPSPASTAAITSIWAVGPDLVVTVTVPPGRRRVTLESRSRLTQGAWTPRGLKWSEGTDPAEITFNLPVGDGLELLRIREESEAELGLPAAFFQGRNSFAPAIQKESIAHGAGIAAAPDTVNPSASFSSIQFSPTVETRAARAVVESDIWKVDGHTAYFFNQQRGLQVIDLSDPDLPVVTGVLPLAVWGEQMYRLPAVTIDGSVWLALLAQQGCDGHASEVLLVNVRAGRPSLAGRLPVRGQIKETRLVGEALYLATYDWLQPPAREIRDAHGGVIRVESLPWESRTLISGFDLANPAQPVAQPVIELPVNPDAIASTDRTLFVATTGTRSAEPGESLPAWTMAGRHAVILFDLSDPHGAVTQQGHFITAGRVTDKFKLGVVGANQDAVAVVSQVDWASRPVDPTNPINGTTWTAWAWQQPQAVIETFSLANPAAPAALGQLTLVTNESLFATRFVEDRAYVVTFRQVDPLWIVDLSNPSQPVVRGELQIPGYSTYLQPLADNTRLLAMGVEGSRTTVQLFDVADATKPALLKKIFLGQGWSWSEANSDEKAFQVFPESGLALVPWQGSRGSAQAWFQGTQLIDFDLGAGTLNARGVIDHSIQARRATLLGNRILSLSGQELLTVNAADRDHPVTVAKLPLSTPVDRVFVHGDQLIQLRNTGSLAAQVTLASAAAPETPLAELTLDPLPIVGAERRGDRLYLVQFRADEWRNQAVVRSNAVIKEVPQPPLESWRTNFVVEDVPPPLVQIDATNIIIREQLWDSVRITNILVLRVEVPRPVATNLVTTTWLKTFPPSPLDPTPKSYLLTRIRPEFIPGPSVRETNAVVTRLETPQPPLLVTHWISSTTWESERIPGESRFSIIQVGAGSLQSASQLTFPNPDGYYGGSLTALWPANNQVVWTERENPQFWGKAWYANSLPIVSFEGGTLVFGNTLQIKSGPVSFPIWSGRWWSPWTGNETRHFLAFDLTDDSAPSFASDTRLGGTNDWNSFSETFAADGKLFVSHRVTQPISSTQSSTSATNADWTITLQPMWEPGTWEHHHFLDVLDFTDVANPVVRTPVELPGLLRGISHNGQLIYTTGSDSAAPTSTTVDQIHALAYDGLQAHLVASMHLPVATPQPLVINSDGEVLLGRVGSNPNESSTLETWAVSAEGRFERYATLALTAAAEELHIVDGLLVVTGGDRFRLYDADVTPWVLLGEADRPCTLTVDWPNAAASPTTGLWLARGGLGLWQAPPTP